MRRYRILALVLPAALILAVGCGKKNKDGGNVDQGSGTKPVAQATGGGPGPGGAKTPIEAKEWTTLKGKVVLDGDVPKDDGALKAQMEKHEADKKVCLEGDTAAFTWRVNPENKGVQNVVVWVKPPDGKYFKPGTPNEDVWKKKDAAFDQPQCAFEPHVQAAFIGYYDGKDNKPSGQKVKVLNSAPMNHNTQWKGDPLRNSGDNPTISPKGEYDMTPKLKADARVPITLSCNIHQWMKGYLWALDTPYYAVTDKDGNFEIKDLPADSEVMVVKWHEAPGFFDGGATGTKVALKPGTTDLGDIKLKK